MVYYENVMFLDEYVLRTCEIFIRDAQFFNIRKSVDFDFVRKVNLKLIRMYN